MTAPPPTAAPTRSPRALGIACLGLAASAGLVAGAAALNWYVVTPAGRAPAAYTGAQVSPSLTGFALVALAGVAAMVAVGGVVRRVLAGLLAAAGAVVVWTGVSALTGHTSLPSGTPASVPVTPGVTAAPLLAVAGGLVLVAVGVFAALREPRLPRLGARYAAPGARAVEVDPDRAAWQDLDAGRDPTADRPRDPDRNPGEGTGDDPGDGAGRGTG